MDQEVEAWTNFGPSAMRGWVQFRLAPGVLIQGGASIRILPLLNFRASAYAIEPSGQQKLFSRFLNHQTTLRNPGASHSGRVFQTTPETTGSADIARDHGFSLGFDSSPFRLVDLAVGYTHSASFSLDTVYFGLGLNLARFFGSSFQ